MTRYNLEKRHLGKPISCEFCSDPETISHLFFDCIIAKRIWSSVSSFLNLQLGSDFESIAKLWLANKKHLVSNSIGAAILWSIWKTINAMIFDNQLWLCSKQVWWLILKTIRKWKLLWKENMSEKMELFAQFISGILRAPEALPWRLFLLLTRRSSCKSQDLGLLPRLLLQVRKALTHGCATGASTSSEGCVAAS
jgi:hypothetical protein